MAAQARILGLFVLVSAAVVESALPSPVDPGPAMSRGALSPSPSPRASMVTEELRHGPAFSVLVSFVRMFAIRRMAYAALKFKTDFSLSHSSFEDSRAMWFRAAYGLLLSPLVLTSAELQAAAWGYRQGRERR